MENRLAENGRMTLYDYCLAYNHTDLLKQWHTQKNDDLHPWDASYGSHKKVWWRCDKGHEWQAEIKSRVQGCGCPVCADRQIQCGSNDLATTHPMIAAEWHPTKNGPLKPTDVTSGMTKKVWWKCTEGHEWFAPISSRTRGSGCPVCSGKVVQKGYNDLASLFPEVAAQWMREKNLPLTPETVTPFSNHRVWWKCTEGHEWQALISARTASSSGCPYCTGRKVKPGYNDLATVYPEIAKEWHPTLNGELTPEMVTVGSKKRVWWRCGEGHEWRAVIYSRTGKNKHGCPVCAGKLVKKTTIKEKF